MDVALLQGEVIPQLWSAYKKTLEYKSLKEELKNRSEIEWLTEWKQMHKKLFEHILIDCGRLRKKDVRFGEPGDEELYKIPASRNVSNELNSLSSSVVYFLGQDHDREDSKFKTLAKIHYQFIRIHPFSDGNGRIARAITDQLAIYFGYPIAMGGYPRHDSKRREAYNRAIRSCVEDPDCTRLAQWIRSYIDIQLEEIA